MSLAVLVAAAIALGPAKTAADDEPVLVAVLPPTGAGLSEDRSALVLETVQAQLPSDRIVLVSQQHVDAALRESASGCATDERCRTTLAERLRARFLVQVSVTEPKASDYDVHIEVVEPATSKVVATLDESCTICSEADLTRVIRERTLDARLALERHLAPEEETATEPVAPPPTLDTAPTKVEVRVAQPSKMTMAGWGLLGAGIAGTLGGVVLLALQGSDAGCPSDPRGGPCLPLVYRTVIPGAVTLSVGAALLGTGVGLVVAGRKRDRDRASARVVPTPTGIAVRGRF